MILAMSIGEKFATGGMTAALGIGVTFLMLVILIFIVTLITKLEMIDFKRLFSKLFKKKNAAESAETKPEEAPQADNLMDNKKLAAAISAAIAVVLSEENADDAPKAAFKVKSIKRI